MPKNNKKDLYVIRKFIMAKDAEEAIKIEKTKPVNDVWMDDDWKKGKIQNTNEKEVGFL